MAEAMGLGKPVIATGYSGNLDFMTPENSLLVSHERVTLERTVHVYERGWTWAEPSVADAAQRMRWVVAHPEAARALGERARRDVRAVLSLEMAGRRMAAGPQGLEPRRAALRRASKCPGPHPGRALRAAGGGQRLHGPGAGSAAARRGGEGPAVRGEPRFRARQQRGSPAGAGAVSPAPEQRHPGHAG